MAFTVASWERASEIFETASAAFARAELDGSVTGVVPTVLLGCQGLLLHTASRYVGPRG
jgi:hypothetical protein